jgi:hypothetical protein
MVRRVLDPHVGQSICGCTQLTGPCRGGGGMVYVKASWMKIVPPTMSMPTTVEPAKNAVYLASKNEVRTTENFRLGGVPGEIVELNLI